MSVLALLTLAALQAAPDAGVATRIRVLVGEQPAPPDTEVRLFEPSRRVLCGTAQYHGAPMRKPDAEGWVSFVDVPPGSSVRAHHPAYGDASLEPAALKDPATPAVIRFPAGLAVSGRVLDAKGRPVTRARVAVVSREPEAGPGGQRQARLRAVNDADGSFTFANLPPGKWAVLADAFDDVWSQGVEVEAGARDVEPRLASRRWITGRVLDAAGQPVKDAWLHLETTSGPPPFRNGPGSPRTLAGYLKLLDPVPDQSHYRKAFGADALGRFEVSVPTSRPVEVWADGPDRSCVVSQRAVSSDSAIGELVLRYPQRTVLTFKAFGAGQVPLREVTVSLRPLKKEGLPLGCDEQVEVLEGKQGVFTTDTLPPGFQLVELSAEGLVPLAFKQVLKAGARLDLGPLTLTDGARLTGTVTDADGQPGMMASIWLDDGAGYEKLGTADLDGTFELDGVPTGKVKVRAVSLSDQPSPEVKLTLLPGKPSHVTLKVP